MDKQGFVRVTGRVKDMIIRGGENHFPAEIEAVLVTHPDVAQVAVVGLPDEKWGEIIAAFILSDKKLDLIELLLSVEAQLLKTMKLIIKMILFILKVIFPISYCA